jgi:hypothetical protein
LRLGRSLSEELEFEFEELFELELDELFELEFDELFELEFDELFELELDELLELELDELLPARITWPCSARTKRSGSARRLPMVDASTAPALTPIAVIPSINPNLPDIYVSFHFICERFYSQWKNEAHENIFHSKVKFDNSSLSRIS